MEETAFMLYNMIFIEMVHLEHSYRMSSNGFMGFDSFKTYSYLG